MTAAEGRRPVWSAVLAVLALCSLTTAALGQEAQSGSPGAPGVSGASGTPASVGIVVKLEDDPVASYRGTLPGLPATSPAVTGAARIDHAAGEVQSYRGYLAGKHAAFEAAAAAAVPGARVTYRYDTVLNGIAMTVREDQIGRIAQIPGVKAVYRDVLLKLHTDSSPTFIGARTLWGKLGGQDDAGEGVVVGMLDTGVWPEHPSLSDPDPRGKPYLPPARTPAQCDLDAFVCQFKLIGAYRFMAAYDQCVTAGGCVNSPGEFSSARDSEGHGTHTASTAAGGRSVEAVVDGVDRRTISGIAPRAHVAVYKVCGRDGCFGSDSVAAIQRAILDDVDVINFSIGGGRDPYNDFVEMAFLDAYAAGVFVAASAGNDGPTPDTVEHRGPWVTTVAASTESRSFTSRVTFVASNRDRLRLAGASITQGITLAAPVVVNPDTFCANTAPAGTFTGQIVVCKRGGGIARIEKGFNVQQRGAIGMILYNNLDNQDVETDNHWVPAVQLTHADGVALLDFLSSHAGVTATFPNSRATRTQGDVMAQFSSRGGVAGALGVGKPDITAPGVQILAGMTPAPADPLDGPPGELFQAIAGTSMSSPHIAGSAALLKQLHPTWTPGQIKSALMTTASTKNLFQDDGVTPFTPFDAGSGRVNLAKAPAPGLTFDVTAAEYRSLANTPWDMNYPSLYLPSSAPNVLTVHRTAQSLLPRATVWTLSVLDAPSDLIVTVPATLSVPAGGTASFDIHIDKTGIPGNQSRHATLQLKSGAMLLHMPIGAAGPVPQPDLIVTAVTAPSTGTRGVGIHTTATIKNQGTATASSFYFQVYLSRNDSTLSLDDTAYWYCSTSVFGALAANWSATCYFDGAIPASIPAGTYYLVVRVDDGQAVSESNENNNIGVFGPITIN